MENKLDPMSMIRQEVDRIHSATETRSSLMYLLLVATAGFSAFGAISVFYGTIDFTITNFLIFVFVLAVFVIIAQLLENRSMADRKLLAALLVEAKATKSAKWALEFAEELQKLDQENN